MASRKVRDFSKRGDALPIGDLTQTQREAYERFLQLDRSPEARQIDIGLESLLREIFPIESYDGTMKLEYLRYALDEPRYTADECRELRLTYGMPFRITVRLTREATRSSRRRTSTSGSSRSCWAVASSSSTAPSV